MISYGKTEWIPEMKRLWQRVFGDEEEYINAFFARMYSDNNALVYADGEKVVAILFMVPYRYIKAGQSEEAVYLYALATDPDHRGRGIMEKLIRKSIELSKKRGYAIMILVPSSTSLYEYYRKFGFQECSSFIKIEKDRSSIEKEIYTEQTLQIQEITYNKIEFIKADAKHIWNAYKTSKFYSGDTILLSEEQNRFYIDELKREGGEALVFDIKERNDGYVLLNYRKPFLELYETNIEEEHLSLFYEALAERYPFSKVIFNQPLCFNEPVIKNNKIAFAMAFNLKNDELPELFINRVLM